MTQQKIAELMARIMGDRDGVIYTVRYEVKGEAKNEGASCVRGITAGVYRVPREGA